MLPGVAFDRTADLYHVKAEWPHQDTRGHRVYVNVEVPLDQSVTCCRLVLTGTVVVKGWRLQAIAVVA